MLVVDTIGAALLVVTLRRLRSVGDRAVELILPLLGDICDQVIHEGDDSLSRDFAILAPAKTLFIVAEKVPEWTCSGGDQTYTTHGEVGL